MSYHPRVRQPISTRHAFALAFDLAVRRDFLSSLFVPFLLRAPWIVALAVLPAPIDSDRPGLVMGLTATALVGDFLMLLLVGAMLRYRARSVFNTPPGTHPDPVMDCYARGLGRVPWLVVTEIVRNLGILFAACFLVLPGLFLGFRLAFATEAVVLHDPNTDAAFRRSFRLTEGRFERWFEMIVASVLLVIGLMFVVGFSSVLLRGVSLAAWVAVARLLVTAITPIIQYAWTFFYLRLVEVDSPAPIEEPLPLYALAAPSGVETQALGPGALPPPTGEAQPLLAPAAPHPSTPPA